MAKSAPLPLKLPSEQTLAKYGLTGEEWLSFIPVIDGVRVCAICWKQPQTGRFVVDHKHVAGYALKSPEERKAYVRGVICTTCNHFNVSRYMTAVKAARTAAYLLDFEERLATWLLTKAT